VEEHRRLIVAELKASIDVTDLEIGPTIPSKKR